MAITPLPIANGFYVDDSLPLSAQECTNWYPHVLDGPALSDQTLRGTPGKEFVATTGDIKQVNRGAHVFGGVAYYVNGTSLWRQNRAVDDDGIASYSMEEIGVIEGSGRVWMADNGSQLCILVPGDVSIGYILTVDPDLLVEITDTDFKANGEPQALVFIDGYFVFTTTGKKFIISDLNDGTSYNALDFGTAEADPDAIVAPIVLRNQLFIGGSESIEGFQNVGGGGFPFQRNGIYISKGIAAPFSIVTGSQSFMFIGRGANEGLAIWEFVGNDVRKISTLAIDSLLSTMTPENTAETFAWSYSKKGSYCVGFTAPNACFVYDQISGRWHQRKSQIVDSLGVSKSVRDRANSYVQAYGEIFVGDAIDGRIGRLSSEEFQEYGNPIVRVISTQPFQNNMQSFLVPWIELTIESGVGNELVSDPKIRMDRSLDGKTWKDDRTRKIGKAGEYGRRVIWRRLGRVKRFEVFRFTMSDPVKPVIIQLTADIV